MELQFKDRVRSMMKDRAWTAKDLAGKIETQEDIDKSVKVWRNVENWIGERASMPSVERAVAIANALDTTVEYLVTGNEEYRYKPAKLPLAIISLARDLLGLSEARLEEIRQIIRVWHRLDSEQIVHDSGKHQPCRIIPFPVNKKYCRSASQKSIQKRIIYFRFFQITIVYLFLVAGIISGQYQRGRMW